MIGISTKGMNDGKHEIDLSVSPGEAKDLPEEFAGDIRIKGNLTKLGKRYNFEGRVTCKAILICDRSLEEYEELIGNELKWTCLEDSAVFRENLDSEPVPGELYALEEDHEIDITNEVTEQLIVAIPMKKIAPEYRGKEIEDIYPGHVPEKKDSNEQVDSRWSKLKEIKFN
jgi:uncharacterized metal-binding protein YceD (DUF177 family)